MAVEIKQALEREFEVILTPQDLRTLTFGKLQELSDGGKGVKFGATEVDSVMEATQKNMLLRSLGDEELADQVIVPLNVTEENKKNEAFGVFVPGIEGVISTSLHTLCKDIKLPIYALQLNTYSREESFSKVVSLVAKVKTLNPK